MSKLLRTPDQRFQDLPDYPFKPNYVQIADPALGDLRLHYVDEGPKDGLAVIMMHGEPSWSFLYRHMIKHVSEAGFRVVAPDLIGFGKSDKPAETTDYSYSNHVRWMSDWFEQLNLKNAVLFCQDWGGLIGLRLVSAFPDNFEGVVAANTFLPTGEGKVSKAFEAWREFSQTTPEFKVGKIIQGATVSTLSEEIVAAYDAPYPDESFKAGARIFPALVPTSPDMDGAADNKIAWQVLSKWTKPFLTAFSDSDPVTGGLDKIFQKNIPGCTGQPHQTVPGGGHFLQEDCFDPLSEIIIEFCNRLSR